MNLFLRRFQKVGTVSNNVLKKQFYNNSGVNHKHLFTILKMWQNYPTKQMAPLVSRYSTEANSKYRSWKTTFDSKPNVPGLPFKIVSYNILAQELLNQHLYLYTRSNYEHLKWSYRLARLTEEIFAQKPDILCLQEVQENHLDDLMTSIKSHLPSMNCIFNKKTGSKCDGCAILYNAKLFQLVQSDVVEFFQPDIELLDRHNIALIAKLRCISNKEAFLLVGTTHLLFNPKRQDVRLAQIMLLLAELDRHSIVKPGKLDRMPIILSGDFNFQASSAPFKLITTGKLRYEELSKKSLTESGRCGSPPIGKRFVTQPWRITDGCQHIDCIKSDYKNCPQKLCSTDLPSNDSELFSTGTLTHALNLKSVYNHFDGWSYGSIFQKEWVTVDHLFYNQGNQKETQQGALTLQSVYQLPNVQLCKLIGGLPNEEYGSDHFLLAARFYLKFPTNVQ